MKNKNVLEAAPDKIAGVQLLLPSSQTIQVEQDMLGTVEEVRMNP